MTLIASTELIDRLHFGEHFISDGAIGTELMRRGIAMNDILAANRRQPQTVSAVHNSYLNAGSDLITSNTFGLNHSDEWGDDLRNGLRLALDCAHRCVRPAGVIFSLISDKATEAETFISSLKDADLKPTLILFETCTSLRTAIDALWIARRACDIPIAVTCHYTEEGIMLDGTPPEKAGVKLELSGADLIGANCGHGPSHFYQIASRIRDAVTVPLLIQPNAGLGALNSTGIWDYPVTPEIFAQYAMELLQTGVAIVGGCCGTRPDHIAGLRRTMSR